MLEVPHSVDLEPQQSCFLREAKIQNSESYPYNHNNTADKSTLHILPLAHQLPPSEGHMKYAKKKVSQSP